jgi:hypothetical protein
MDDSAAPISTQQMGKERGDARSTIGKHAARSIWTPNPTMTRTRFP